MGWKVIRWDEYDPRKLWRIPRQRRAAGNPGTKTKYEYLDVICAFDIETTRLLPEEQAFCYHWQMTIGDDVITGRTIEEAGVFFETLSRHLREEERLCIFVHNLSYEFQFLRGIYDFSVDDVFAVKSRKVLRCYMYDKTIEFRCSYLHSNMSLDTYTAKMGAKHRKMSGEDFDYSAIRYPWTEISEKELEYCITDVVGLCEAIKIEMEKDGDNFYTFPLTSTGYVRRDAKRAMRLVGPAYVKNQLPDFAVYEMLREAFRGGNTHANRYYAGLHLHDVKSADRSSSYPDVQCNCEFPVSEFFKAGKQTFDEVVNLITKRKKAVLMRVAIHSLRLIDDMWGCPYLSRDKCRNIVNGDFDNGRILSADYLETTITDVDFKIIISEYDFDDFIAVEVYHARYGRLPRPLLDVTIGYYRAKTELKGVPGEEIYYTKAKNKLNSIYGMSAQDPVKQDIIFENGDWTVANDDPEDILRKTQRHAFLAYQWGVWITAWARYRLEEGIRIAGDGFVYCDTDSVKYKGEIDWKKYNDLRKKDSIKSGAWATDPAGKKHYMGVYEFEGVYDHFKTLGAKKYVVEKDGKIEITIAGVEKDKGGKELAKYGGIDAFKPGFIFREAGGIEAVYNDKPEIEEVEREGRKIHIGPNVVLRESEYTLGITAEYERLLNRSNLY